LDGELWKQLRATLRGRRVYVSDGAGLALVVAREPASADLERLVQDMKASSLTDVWDMSLLGGHREIEFQVAGKRLYGRFDPISESWLRTIVPTPAGETFQLSFDPDAYRVTL